jgi:hypothetical protein
MQLRNVLGLLAGAALLAAACTSSDDDGGSTVGSGGSSTSSVGGAGGSGGANNAGCPYWELVDQTCAELMATELFAEPTDCLDEGIYADASEWQATLTDCADPNDDPLAAYDWSQPVLVVAVTVPGCDGEAELLAVRECMDGVHVGTSNTPGCCGCGDSDVKVGIAVGFMQSVTVHACGSENCADDDMCGS